VNRSYTPPLAYSALTPFYDITLELLGFGAAFKNGVARLADVREQETVLDLGCGTGSLLRALTAQQPHARYTGLDPDLRALAAARRRLRAEAGRVSLIQGYAQHLPMTGQSFDVVLSTLIFHHLPDDAKRQAMREVHRVLRPGGRLLLVDFGKPRTVVARVQLRLGSVFDGSDNMRTNLAGGLPAMLADAGFSPTEIAPGHRGVRYLLCRPEQS
jgi:ubiquinone/menaquinone biosynthesis C-methylase UbiE